MFKNNSTNKKYMITEWIYYFVVIIYDLHIISVETSTNEGDCDSVETSFDWLIYIILIQLFLSLARRVPKRMIWVILLTLLSLFSSHFIQSRRRFWRHRLLYHYFPRELYVLYDQILRSLSFLFVFKYIRLTIYRWKEMKNLPWFTNILFKFKL